MKLSTESLRKAYRGRYVVNDVSIEVSTGEIVGLLGPNGAGKTTTFYMVVGMTPPTRARGARRRRHHRDADVPARPARHQLPAAGASCSAHVGGRTTCAPSSRRSTHPAERERRIETLIASSASRRCAKHGVRAVGRRAAPRRDRARPGHRPVVHPPRRAVRGIDPIAVLDIQTIVRRLREFGFGILITDHNVRETLKITDRPISSTTVRSYEPAPRPSSPPIQRSGRSTSARTSGSDPVLPAQLDSRVR